ncbi:MAG: DUF5652 family protein [Patescibacteria group bacterium]|nr:DUF5652 family protein [Patescibacteria group bacterium]
MNYLTFYNFNAMQNLFQNYPYLAAVISALFIWLIIWKGIALWKAARLNDKWWFIALLVVNTVGILEILYIYVFSKRKNLEQSSVINSQ